MTQEKVKLAYFTDILCVWAYTAQARLDELKKQLGSKLEIEYHFIPIFSCTSTRIGEGWKEKGGFSGFSEHTKSIGEKYPHVKIHPDIWTKNIPASSANSHLFFKAVQLLQKAQLISDEPNDSFEGRNLFEEFLWQSRIHFFEQAKNIADHDIQFGILENLDIPRTIIEKYLKKGDAMAALFNDIEIKEAHNIEGSPSYLLNEGRQKLYGNVSYNIIAANVQEIIEKPDNQASWC